MKTKPIHRNRNPDSGQIRLKQHRCPRIRDAESGAVEGLNHQFAGAPARLTAQALFSIIGNRAAKAREQID
jgi:hypothetical protein